MSSKSFKSNLLLLLVSIIWGLSFVAQSVGMDSVGPLTFICARTFIAVIVLIPCIKIIDKVNAQASSNTPKHFPIKEGIICGLLIFVANLLQQVGLQYTTVGKAGFITSMYIVIVAILGIFVGKRIQPIAWVSVAIAVVGLYLLCMSESLSLDTGDILILGCAFMYSIYIMVIDYFSPLVDGVRMSCVQFTTCCAVSFIPAMVLESPTLSGLQAGLIPILYAGAMASAAGYTLQIIAQRNTEPVIASLIMSLESVFSLIAGWILLGQYMTLRELIGCLIMFIAIILPGLHRD